MSKAGTSTVKMEACPLGLRSVSAVIPTKEEEKQQLAEDLTKMGCEGLQWRLGNEERGDGAGVVARALERMGGDHSRTPGRVGSGLVGGCLQFQEIRKNKSSKDGYLGQW